MSISLKPVDDDKVPAAKGGDLPQSAQGGAQPPARRHSEASRRYHVDDELRRAAAAPPPPETWQLPDFYSQDDCRDAWVDWAVVGRLAIGIIAVAACIGIWVAMP